MGLCVVQMWAETQTTSRRTRDPARVEREDESTPLLTRHLDGAHASAQLRFARREKWEPRLVKPLLQRRSELPNTRIDPCAPDRKVEIHGQLYRGETRIVSLPSVSNFRAPRSPLACSPLQPNATVMGMDRRDAFAPHEENAGFFRPTEPLVGARCVDVAADRGNIDVERPPRLSAVDQNEDATLTCRSGNHVDRKKHTTVVGEMAESENPSARAERVGENAGERFRRVDAPHVEAEPLRPLCANIPETLRPLKLV